MNSFLKFIKDFLIFTRITLIFQPIAFIFNYLYYWNRMLMRVHGFGKKIEFNDYYKPVRNYNDRFKLYDYIFQKNDLTDRPLLYLEFGVAAGSSFRKMMESNTNSESRFFGFDTFEGLPENWAGFYKKGDMSSDVPELVDSRGEFIKGLFQDTLVPFIYQNIDKLKNSTIRVIHMDADLYSATIFTLSQLYPFLQKGDIIFFDEFNVPMHEMKAFEEFQSNFYINLKPLGAVNNYYQMAFVVE